MAVSQSDLESFQRFAAERIAAHGAESLAALLHEWEALRERRDTIDSVHRGLADIDAGRTMGAAELLDRLRDGLTPK